MSESPPSPTKHTIEHPPSHFFTAAGSCANARIAHRHCSEHLIPMHVSMVAATNGDCRVPRRGGGGTEVGGEGKKIQGRHKTGVPVECASPPIREGIFLLPKLTSHKPPLSSTTSSSLSLMIKKNEERKATQRNFDNIHLLAWGLHSRFFLMGLPPICTYAHLNS